MNKVKIGVMGVGRGRSMMNFCIKYDGAELVAICDNWVEGLEKNKEEIAKKGLNVAFYTDFDEFIEHDMDLVVLANYAVEHAPFAIKALKKGKNVLSELVPCVNMKEAVELVEAIEESGKHYFYAENACFMMAPREMKKLYDEGRIGKFEYAECEYLHCTTDKEHIEITKGSTDHWRSNIQSTFYCTHSLGPMIHASGLRPKYVTGFELPMNERMIRRGYLKSPLGIEMVELENGAIIKSQHGGAVGKYSLWYSMYGSKGHMESGRCENGGDGAETIKIQNYDDEFKFDEIKSETYKPLDNMSEEAKNFGHGGSDFYMMYNCVQKMLGNENADVIGIYEALDMYLPGMFAYFSILEGGKKLEIPNLRNKEEREKWRNNTACTIAAYAGDMLLPSNSSGVTEIPQEVKDKLKKDWEELFASENILKLPD